jgi:ABC-type multidrug transport system fused ATPase/permease subunit
MASNWIRNIGYVPQRIFLIDDTIRNNIALGIHENDIDDLKIQHAIKASQLNNFINSLPNGINTYVGDKGIQISGGQNQRIAIARAIYNNPQILILDEATSSLDNLTEKEFIKSIEFFKNKKTIIIISHRSSSLVNCDKIFEMKEGKLFERNSKSTK